MSSVRVNVRVDGSVAGRAKAAYLVVSARTGSPGSFALFVQECLEAGAARVEAEFNAGERFPGIERLAPGQKPLTVAGGDRDA